MLVLGVIGFPVFFGGLVYSFTHKQRTPIPKRTLEEIGKAERGDAKAQYGLALCYEGGFEGLAKDEEKALNWFRKAALLNNAKAQFRLALCYQAGQGVPKNDAESLKWFRKAAELNQVEAQFHLGLLYNRGTNVVRDDLEALKWFRRAAEQDHIFGQCSVASAYAYGRGVETNYVEAYAWNHVVSTRVVSTGGTMNALATKMTPEEIADALKRSLQLRSQIDAKLKSGAIEPYDIHGLRF